MNRQTALQTTQANNIQVAPPAAPCNEWSYGPPIDVIERENEYQIVCDVPGARADSLELTFENGVLHLHASVEARSPQNGEFIVQEYGVGDYDRDLPLGRLAEFVDVDQISAECGGGVATVHLSKLEHSRPRKIQVSAA